MRNVFQNIIIYLYTFSVNNFKVNTPASLCCVNVVLDRNRRLRLVCVYAVHNAFVEHTVYNAAGFSQTIEPNFFHPQNISGPL